MKEFCLDTFLSEIRSATADIVVTEAQIEELQGKINAVVMEFVYAAIWQVRAVETIDNGFGLY